jgi:NADPH-dependent F420 reductase
MPQHKHTIAVLGGTGAVGSGLALRWAHAGHDVLIGSRDAAKAQSMAGAFNAELGAHRVRGMAMDEAARTGGIAVLTVPFAAELDTARSLRAALQGKILVDVTVPLVPPKVSLVQLPASGSCVVAVQQELGESVRVVSAFQNVSAHKLKKLDHPVTCDVLVCGDDKAARQTVIELAADAGLRGIDAGPLANSVVAESLTSVLIFINRAYKIPDAGIAITGVG